ncbi:hypothetical protein C8Q80DRAFT_910413 [Daedaleopsis nitida]|nr:hypothetical protein C8Q80DRAFT_910413 [Daedaleopsis nitida]
MPSTEAPREEDAHTHQRQQPAPVDASSPWFSSVEEPLRAPPNAVLASHDPGLSEPAYVPPPSLPPLLPDAAGPSMPEAANSSSFDGTVSKAQWHRRKHSKERRRMKRAREHNPSMHRPMKSIAKGRPKSPIGVRDPSVPTLPNDTSLSEAGSRARDSDDTVTVRLSPHGLEPGPHSGPPNHLALEQKSMQYHSSRYEGQSGLDVGPNCLTKSSPGSMSTLHLSVTVTAGFCFIWYRSACGPRPQP